MERLPNLKPSDAKCSHVAQHVCYFNMENFVTFPIRNKKDIIKTLPNSLNWETE